MKTIRIGGAGGFLGDSATALPQLLEGGDLDYVVLDYLAEVTLSLLGRSQAKRPEGGYASDFTEWCWKDNLHALKEKGVKLVTNAGALNPRACVARMEAIAKEAGLSFKIALVEGDDLRPRLSELADDREIDTGALYPDAKSVMSANAYFGAGPIAAALAAGADIVITGRVVDSALVLGPLVHEFGWRWDEFDKLSAGSLCGHVLECGAQATGGLFTDWEEVKDWAHIGYPIAECAEDGSFIVTKPPNTGGLCTPATVAEQILYETGDPQAYLLPDVSCDFTEVKVESVGDQRVRVSGAKGYAPSGKYKICTTYQDGYRIIALMPVVGRDAAKKAIRQSEAVLERVDEMLRARNLGPFRATRIEALGSEATYGANARASGTREVIAKVGVEHEDPAAISVLIREFDSPTTSMSVGSTGWFGARPAVSPVVRVFSTLVPRERISARVVMNGKDVTPPAHGPSQGKPPAPIPVGETAKAESNWSARPLIDLAWARSGDKGDAFNIGVIARKPEYMPYIRAALSEEAVKAFFAHEFEGAERPSIKRYELPGLGALNFHLRQSLGGGQMSTLRLDALAKGKAQQLLDFPIPVPPNLI
ncbi:MAG: acyclic terpene utilization AtuA family protein [Caulobacterales bacterium]